MFYTSTYRSKMYEHYNHYCKIIIHIRVKSRVLLLLSIECNWILANNFSVWNFQCENSRWIIRIRFESSQSSHLNVDITSCSSRSILYICSWLSHYVHFIVSSVFNYTILSFRDSLERRVTAWYLFIVDLFYNFFLAVDLNTLFR